MSIRKVLAYSAACIAAAGLCFIVIVAGLAYRYFAAGVNPYREIKMATLGESIEIKEHPESDGRIYRQLLIDGIDHGSQYQGKKTRFDGVGEQPNWSRLPTTYYHRDGPIGMAFSKLPWGAAPDRPLHLGDAGMVARLVSAASGDPWTALGATWSEPAVGVIMMNNGTLAAYARPFQFVDFYESNPRIVGISAGDDPKIRQFSYIPDAKARGANIRLFEGQERKTFDHSAPKQFYHLLIVDTSHGHPGLPSKELLTKEAWQSYFSSLVEEGVVCVHTSSRDYELVKIVAATTNDLGLAHLRIHDGLDDRTVGHYTSEWVLVARSPKHLAHVTNAIPWLERKNRINAPHQRLDIGPEPVNAALVWTDAGSNSLAPVRR